MKRLLFAVLSIALLAGADVTTPADRALVVVDHPGARGAGELLDAGVTVLRDMGGYLVALATPQDLRLIERRGYTQRTIDSDPSGKTFYIATTPTPASRDRVRAGATIQMASDYGSVIEATPEQANRLAGEGVELSRLFMTPMRAPDLDKAPPRMASAVPDPLIEAMVDSVSIDRINATVQRLQDFTTRHSWGDSVLAARDWLVDRYHSAGIDSVTLHQFDPLYGDNVVAVKPGLGNPDKLVIIGAHYDSVTKDFDNCPGADDNGSGTACVLECARVLAPYDFDYTLVFISFCGEEQGLIGSEAWAAAAETAGYDIVAMINVDMIGYTLFGDAVDLDIVSNASSQWLRDLFMETSALYQPAFAVVDGSLPAGANSDHASFWRHGYDAIMFWEDTGNHSPYIHTINDVVGLSYNNPDLAFGSIRDAVATLATIADPFRVVVLHTPIGNTEDTQGMLRVDAEILHAAALDTDSLYVNYTLTLPDVAGAILSGPARTPPPTKTTLRAPFSYLGSGNSWEAIIPPQPPGTVVDYYLVAGDVNGFKGYNPRNAPEAWHRFTVGTPTAVVSEDFETDTGWSAGIPGDDAINGVWERGTPNAVYFAVTLVVPDEDHSAAGSQCYMTENTPPGSNHNMGDVDGGATTLLSPVYNLGDLTNAWVSYYRWYSNDTGGNVDDVWRVDVSDDGGASWVNLETLGVSDRQWTRIDRFLGDYIELTSAVRFRFVASDSNLSSVVEALVDDFEITQYTGAVTGADPPGVTVALGQNYPNPFNPRTTIHFTVTPPGARATLRVYNVAGQLVTTLVDNETVSGETVIQWDGRDRFGHEIASGVYFCRLDAGGLHQTRKMVVIR